MLVATLTPDFAQLFFFTRPLFDSGVYAEYIQLTRWFYFSPGDRGAQDHRM